MERGEPDTRKGVSLTNGLHIETFKYSHQPEEPVVFILLPTDKC